MRRQNQPEPKLSPIELQDSTFEFNVRPTGSTGQFCASETEQRHALAELSAIPATRISNHQSRGGLRMSLDESRQQLCVIGLVQHITAEDQIEFAQCSIRRFPGSVHIWDGFEMIQLRVVNKKLVCERMMIARRDICAAPSQYEARECKTATRFQNA